MEVGIQKNSQVMYKFVCILASGTMIDEPVLDVETKVIPPVTLKEVKNQTILKALTENGGNMKKTAQQLKMGRQTLYDVMDREALTKT
jgi:DNA-binding NtrC family response regulator